MAENINPTSCEDPVEPPKGAANSNQNNNDQPSESKSGPAKDNNVPSNINGKDNSNGSSNEAVPVDEVVDLDSEAATENQDLKHSKKENGIHQQEGEQIKAEQKPQPEQAQLNPPAYEEEPGPSCSAKDEKTSADEAPPAYEEKPLQENIKITDDNFWLEGSFKKVTKRIEDGAKVLEDVIKMLHERAEIENLYANKLQGWCKKWQENFYKSGEYGSMSSSLVNSFKEGSSLSDLHYSVSGKIEELSKDIQTWKSQNYQKTLTKLKEFKRSEDAFSKAQKPWIIKYNEAKMCMKAYHSANALRDNGKKQEEEAKNNPTITHEQITKISAKVQKAEQDIEMTREKYKDALRDIGNYNNKYIEDMKYEFGRCQKFEETRKNYMKERMLMFHACVNRDFFVNNYEKIYKEMEDELNTIDVNNDLLQFEKICGPCHSFIYLHYVEYDPVKHGSGNTSAGDETFVSSKSKKKSGICNTL